MDERDYIPFHSEEAHKRFMRLVSIRIHANTGLSAELGELQDDGYYEILIFKNGGLIDRIPKFGIRQDVDLRDEIAYFTTCQGIMLHVYGAGDAAVLSGNLPANGGPNR